MTSLNLSIFIVNNFCVINCLNINRVRIYGAKCLGIVALKALPTSFLYYHSEAKNTDPENEAKLNWYKLPYVSSMIKFLEGFEKTASFYAYISKSLLVHFNPSQNVSLSLLLNGLVMVINEGSMACKCVK